MSSIAPMRAKKNIITQLLRSGAVTLSAASVLFTQAVMAQQVSGKVVDRQGQAISNAVVSIDGNKIQFVTDKNGRFVFDNLAKGQLELHTSAQNYSHKNTELTIGNNDIDNVTIVLAPSVMEVIDVHATPLHSSSIESALPVNVIAADELKMKQASTLGDTLKNEVGVHSSAYGGVASTPIIRGLDGPRVLITQNGLDVGDASRVGPDHAVAAEASTASQIEVLRGPATLFYGSGAIGGVVNVVDERVPTSNDFQADWLLQYNDAANENQGAINLTTGQDNFAFHVDGFWRDSKDYKLAGPAELEHHDEEHHDEEHHDEEHEEHEASSNRLENSASQSHGFTLGGSYLLDNGFVGLSYGRMEREYGIPGHSHGSHEEHDEDEHDEHEDHEDHEESVYAKMEQDRLQLLSELNFDGNFINKLATKLAYTDYQHQEIEAGLVGTTFTNQSYEARADIYHRDFNAWQGAWTLHFKQSDFKALGDEAFTPPSKSQTVALAWLEERHFGPVLLQLGARVEQVDIEADDTLIGFEEEHDGHGHDEVDVHHQELVSFDKQSFTPISGSVGLVWDYAPGYNIGLSTAFSQRAPSAAELFSFGPHIGANTFEVGAMFTVEQEGDEIHVELAEQEPAIETSVNFDITWRKFEGDFGFVVSAFYNQVDDYYYQKDTGLTFVDEHDHEAGHEDEHEGEEEGLPILSYQQDDAKLYGVEAELVYQISSPLKATIFADYIRAKLTDVEAGENANLPRIPPMRLGALLNYQAENYDAELSVSQYFKQDDVASLETETDGYTMVDAHFNYYVDGLGDDFVVYLKGLNLADENARVHSSFLKDVAPLPGRSFSIGIRGSF